MISLSSSITSHVDTITIAILLYLTVLLLFKREHYCLLVLYTGVFFLRPGEVVPPLGAIRLELIVAIITLVSIFVSKAAVANLRKTFGATRIPRAFVLFLLIICFGIPFAYWPGQAFRSFLDFFKLCLFFVMIAALVDTEQKLYSFSWYFVLFSAWVGFIPFLNVLQGHMQFAQDIERVRGAVRYFTNPNVLACTLAQAIPFVIYLFLYERNFFRKGLLAGIGCLLTSVIVFSGSRGAFLSFIAALFAIFILRSRRKVLGLLGLCLFGTLLFCFMPDQYVERQKTMLHPEDVDSSTTGRFQAWSDGLELFSDSPVLGVGIGNFGPARGAAFEDWLWPHNLFIQLVTETGLLGSLSWVCLMGLVLRRMKTIGILLRDRSNHKSLLPLLNNALFVSILVQFVTGVSQHNLFLFGFYFMISLVLVVHSLLVRSLEESGTTLPSRC